MCFPSMFIQTIVDISRSKDKSQKLFFPMFIFRILRFLGLSDFPRLELVHLIASIGATYLRQRHAQMKSVEPGTRTSKRPRGDAATSFGAMPATEETFVDPIATVDPIGGAEGVDPIVAPPLSRCAMMQSIMTTQATYGHLLDELILQITGVLFHLHPLRTDFVFGNT